MVVVVRFSEILLDLFVFSWILMRTRSETVLWRERVEHSAQAA